MKRDVKNIEYDLKKNMDGKKNSKDNIKGHIR